MKNDIIPVRSAIQRSMPRERSIGRVPVGRQLEAGPEPDLLEAPEPELAIRAVPESIVDKQLTKDASRLMALHHSIDERKTAARRVRTLQIVLIVVAVVIVLAGAGFLALQFV